MYNREDVIGRAIKSCLDQSFEDFELIVIDDGSDDSSFNIVNNFKDARVKLLVNDINRGPCPARNKGIKHAKGQWFVMLDSDFSLLTGALENLYNRTISAPEYVGNIASSCLWDRRWQGGNVTPLPDIPKGIIDYFGYLRWSDTLTVSEYFNCIRREVFNDICYPESRAWETSFHLDLAFNWKLHVTRDIVVKIHTDASNRLTTAKGNWAMKRKLREAEDKLQDLNLICRKHGEAIINYAPLRYQNMLREAGRLYLLLGQRREGVKFFQRYLRWKPDDVKAWMILMSGLIGPSTLAWFATRKR